MGDNGMTHEQDCKCSVCNEGIEAVRTHERECMEKYGWYAHFLYEEGEMHTHGLPESFDHPDLEIRLPIEPKLGHSLFCNAVDLIKGGLKFEDGVLCNRIVSNFNVKFVAAIENGRPVLRIILPDPQGEIDEDKMEEAYAHQYAHLTVEGILDSFPDSESAS